MILRVGCAGMVVPRARYAEALGAVELKEAFLCPPGEKAARAWRSDLGECAVALPASQLVTSMAPGDSWRGVSPAIPAADAARYGAFRDTAEVARAWAATLVAAEHLRARVIVFLCPPSFTPSDENKSRLARFFGGADRAGRTFVLELRGVWEGADVLSTCASLDVVPAIDPLDDEAPPFEGPFAYFRLPGPMTARHRYDDHDLAALRERCASFDEAWCIFSGAAMWDDARRFAAHG